MAARALIEKARAQGFEVRSEGGRLFLRGPRHLESLARELLRHRREVVLALTAPALNALDWFALDDLLDPTDGGRLPRPFCYCCRGSRWWRLRRTSSGLPGFWVCGDCHEPEPPESAIEWSEPATYGGRGGRHA